MAEQQKTRGNRPDQWNRWVLQTARTWADVEAVIEKTGIDRIDDDHKQMTLYVLELNQLIHRIETSNYDIEYVEEQTELFDRIYKFAEVHFVREEELIQKYKIPGIEKQEAEHERFLSLLDGFRHDFEAGRLTISLELKYWILDWWVHHINVIDMNTFSQGHWGSQAISEATDYHQLTEIIRQMGLSTVDDEHHQMTNRTLEFSHWLDHKDPDLSEGLALLQAMRDTAVSHFEHEEALIVRYQLQNLEEQKTQHQLFLQMINDVEQDLVQGKKPSSEELKKVILDWWVQHINGIDAETFCAENWVSRVISDAKSWEEIAELILPTNQGVIDDDHHQITELVLQFHQQMETGSTGSPEELQERTGRIHQLFQELEKAVLGHFKREERLIAKLELPNLNIQKRQHKKFLALLNNYQEHIDNGRLKISGKLKIAMLEWWANHINKLDNATFNGINLEEK